MKKLYLAFVFILSLFGPSVFADDFFHLGLGGNFRLANIVFEPTKMIDSESSKMNFDSGISLHGELQLGFLGVIGELGYDRGSVSVGKNDDNYCYRKDIVYNALQYPILFTLQLGPDEFFFMPELGLWNEIIFFDKSSVDKDVQNLQGVVGGFRLGSKNDEVSIFIESRFYYSITELEIEDSTYNMKVWDVCNFGLTLYF